MTQDLVGRVRRLLLSPKSEWDAIDKESVEPQSLVTGYVVPLAAIPAIAGLIGVSIIGVAGFRAPLASALVSAIVTFALTVGWVFVFAFIIDALAPTFGAEKNYKQALKVSAFAPTASWVAGIFTIIPMLGLLAFVGALYSLYLLFVGLPKMMKPPTEKSLVYTLASIGAAIVAAIVISFAAGQFTPTPTFGAFSANSVVSSDMHKRAAALEKAAESGDANAVLDALSGLAGGDPNAPVVDGEALRKLAPERVAGLKRQSLEIETLSAPFKAVVMKAAYGEGEKTVRLSVTNSPAVSAMMGFAGIAGGEYSRSSDDGYERMRRDGDTVIIEEWTKSSKRGRYGRSVAGSFLIEAEGTGVDMKALENAVKDFKERELKGLPKAS